VCVCVNNLPKIINRERYAVTETIKLLFTGSVWARWYTDEADRWRWMQGAVATDDDR